MSGKPALTAPEKWIVLGIPTLFAVGSVMHFIYDISGRNPVSGLIAPANESVWEHAKMVVWPVILWWVLYDWFWGRKVGTDKNRWYGGALLALSVALIVMPMLYYFYTEAFGTEFLWVDILILLLSLLSGQMAGLHAYRHGRGIPHRIVLLLFTAIILLFMLFTLFPPHIPWFQDGVSGRYGLDSLSIRE